MAFRPVTLILKTLIKGYQLLLSPVLAGRCRYQPTCSSYAIDAIDSHGPVKGLWLAIKRIGRCQPWGGYGYDPVPEKYSEKPSGEQPDFSIDAHSGALHRKGVCSHANPAMDIRNRELQAEK